MIDPLDAPPVLVLRTLVCRTDGCENEGVAIEMECASTVVCGGCGQGIALDAS